MTFLPQGETRSHRNVTRRRRRNGNDTSLPVLKVSRTLTGMLWSILVACQYLRILKQKIPCSMSFYYKDLLQKIELSGISSKFSGKNLFLVAQVFPDLIYVCLITDLLNIFVWIVYMIKIFPIFKLLFQLRH